MKLPTEIEEASDDYHIGGMSFAQLYAKIGLSVLKEVDDSYMHPKFEGSYWDVVEQVKSELQEVLDGD